MKKYKIDKNADSKSDSDLARYKNFEKLSAKYENMTRRPKPLYKNPKVFFVLVMVAVVAWLVAEGVFDRSANESRQHVDPIEYRDSLNQSDSSNQ